MTWSAPVRTAIALARPVVEPPPTATTQSKPPEPAANSSACSVTDTGVCMAAPSNLAAASGPSSFSTSSPASASCGPVSTSARFRPSRSTSSRTWVREPTPNTTRTGWGV
jgi:hypothetical protein